MLALNMHQRYLGHVVRVTKATGGAYIACAVCFARVCVGMHMLVSTRRLALKMCDQGILQGLKKMNHLEDAALEVSEMIRLAGAERAGRTD